MPEDRNSSDSDYSDVEMKLGRLMPRRLEGAFESRLSRRMELAETERTQQRVLWMRFAPVAGLSLAALVIAMAVQSQLRQPAVNGGGDPEPIALGSPSADLVETTAAPAPRPPDRVESPAGEFLPVSRQNYLKQAHDAGILDTRTPVPARWVRLEFEDAWHWHDPETQTNIRVFRPWEEFIMVPVETD